MSPRTFDEWSSDNPDESDGVDRPLRLTDVRTLTDASGPDEPDVVPDGFEEVWEAYVSVDDGEFIRVPQLDEAAVDAQGDLGYLVGLPFLGPDQILRPIKGFVVYRHWRSRDFEVPEDYGDTHG